MLINQKLEPLIASDGIYLSIIDVMNLIKDHPLQVSYYVRTIVQHGPRNNDIITTSLHISSIIGEESCIHKDAKGSKNINLHKEQTNLLWKLKFFTEE